MLKALKILYDGAPVNHKMFFAIQSCAPLIEGPASHSLLAIQKEFGKKVIAKGYTKLYNVTRLCTKSEKTSGEQSKNLTSQDCSILFWKVFSSSYGGV